jgi:DNA-binding MarR family transcriptional regulator
VGSAPPPSRKSRIEKPANIKKVIQDLAWFRYNLRKFLRFSEKAARQCGVTPQQHQLMLGVAGFTGNGSATVSQLAEFLQERHNSVVGLVERAELRGLVRRKQGTNDRRLVMVSLTRQGEQALSKLAQLHQEEVKRVKKGILKPSKTSLRASGASRES